MVHVDARRRPVAAPPDRLWAVVEGLGGTAGWHAPPLVWGARGLLDALLGGPGRRRGRPDRAHLAVGDAVDSWRVEQVGPGRRLVLRSEMRLPGTARLELAVEEDHGRTVLSQRVVFDPRGLAGSAYWWLVAPVHGLVFATMARGTARAAERATDPEVRS